MDTKKTSPLSNAVRRKSAGSSQLRSPLAKRSPQAPVSQKGWLQKQGSDGLMLWKKRWCVLAEHCLFYYKTQEEEKLLGSILLPSYRVSPCNADDKVYKKFAFKVEHANMRTYIFAAETREKMVQWMNALSLSTILQETVRDDGGFAVLQQPERRNDININGWVPHQPLYANAPPKPRRVGNEHSPEPSPDLQLISQHYHPYPYQRPNHLSHPYYVRPNPQVPNYQHPNQFYQGYHQLSSVQQPPPPQPTVSARRTFQPPRPHSADFLDHDAKKYYEYQETMVVKRTDVHQTNMTVQRQRPKSSLDIVQNADDRYYWSEERYAEKMRQSAMHLQQRIADTPQRHWEGQETFTRSASARLSRQTPDDEESDEVTTYTGGGDDSMKRLIEWKQRMLASPLTRKPSGSSGRGSAQNELSKFYKQQVLRELERQEAKSREELGRKRYRSRSTDGRRSAMASNRYNSYSSDDEDKDEQNRGRNRRGSQSNKQRRTSDEAKPRRPAAPDPRSPDYENVTQIPNERTGRMSAPPVRTNYKDNLSESFEKTAGVSQLCNGGVTSSNSDKVSNLNELLPLAKDSEAKQMWCEKLDESKLIKEFSYQYINENSSSVNSDKSFKLLETPPENIVKSRIKQLGLDGREEVAKDVVMREPLKVSSPSYLLNEAFVSHLRNSENVAEIQDRRNSKNLRTFALGPQKFEELPVTPEPLDKSPKTVKDLLADFERKSQLAQERLEHERNYEDSAGKRYVFSDTETLLYDTSSDTDDRKNATDSSILTNLRRTSIPIGGSEDQTEEEGDEEVAAALGRRDRFFSSCREIGQKKEDGLLNDKNRSKAPDDGRLSVTDSMVVQDSESDCNTPTIEMIKDRLEKSLPKENVKTNNAVETPEGHYMPMSPSRRVSAPPSDKSRSNSSLHSVLYGVDIEETYVEMGEHEPNKTFIARSRSSLNQSNESHYEFLYRTSSQREPEYMEVSNIMAALKEEERRKKDVAPPTPPRSALPDILNSSSAQPQKSDSSDADDESSKDLDSLDAPSHPRFSLSDTFRPASYYLGNIMGTVIERHPSENHDSSDSDLVSPPPIPTSPPPIEDLDTSLETEASLDLSLQSTGSSTRKLKISDHDASKRLWSKPIRSSQDIKRRPLSENLIESLESDDAIDRSILESAGNRSGLVLDDATSDINLDQYLEGLQLGDKVNPQMYSKDFRSYEMQRNLTESFNKNDVTEKSLLHLGNIEEPVRQNQVEEVEYENLQAMFPPPPPELYESSDVSDRENGGGLYRNLPLDVPPPANYCDSYDANESQDIPKVRFDPDTLLQKDGADNQAPYYYSDLNKSGAENPTALAERSVPLNRPRFQPLNNQRDDLNEGQQGLKRNDIGRKVNPINQLIADEGEEANDAERMAAELRTTTADFMGDADKTGSVDVRNIYEADTLQRRKAVIPVGLLRVRTPDLQHPQGIARNLYPHGLRDKSASGNNLHIEFEASDTDRRTRSVEGLLEEAVERPFRPTTCDADNLWDEDNLWRDSLRRVSRSLDNLDDGRSDQPSRESSALSTRLGDVASTSASRPPAQIPSGRRSVDACTLSRPKLSRGVTYVNDSARRMALSEYEHDYREVRKVPKSAEDRRFRELPDSNLEPCDDGVHYERLVRGAPPTKHSPGEPSLNQYDWDADREVFRSPNPSNSSGAFLEDASHPHIEPIDRERLRQWDLMSSGTVEERRAFQEEAHRLKDGKADGVCKDGQTSQYHQKQSLADSTQASPLPTASEASATGSVMRESQLGRAAPAEEATAPVAHPHPVILRSQENSPNRREEYETRLDYYDRGKMPYRHIVSPINGYSHWQDAYSPYSDSAGRGDVIAAYPDQRRPLSEYNVDHRVPDQQRYLHTKQPQPVGGTLPHVKSSHSVGGAPGRSAGTLPLPKHSAGRSGGQQYQENRQPGRDYHHPGKRDQPPNRQPSTPWGLDVSAGELLGRTHEELVLLLIQLRRQSAGVCKAMEACHIEIEAQARLAELETPKRMEHLQRLEELKRHLLELEKQYEKGKPLVNLVDNMVKLGSLYRGNNTPTSSSYGPTESEEHVREKLEFNQKVQEQRLLAQERREWDRLSPDQNQLQAKVQQLYKLDRLLQEESGTLHSLQQDKELLEKALGGLRHKMQISKGNPLETDRCRQQQKLLQKELSRVRVLLAHNSKKLEETVAENARLEQELVILRQKLQSHRMDVSRPNSSLLESSTTSTTQALEAELRRVQTLVGDIQRQRQELSAQVRQLTEKNDNLVQQIRPGPTGVAGAGPIPGKKRSGGTWLETDLDQSETQDLAVATPTSSPQHLPSPVRSVDDSRSITPIYINTELTRKNVMSPTTAMEAEGMAMTPVELSEADERMKRYYGIIPREKQEIKTVRIVKRESERRQRDRDRTGNIGLPLGNTAVAKRVAVVDEVDEEEPPESPEIEISDPYAHFHPTNPFIPQNMAEGQRSMSLPRGFGAKAPPPPPQKQEQCNSLRNTLIKKNRVRFDPQSTTEWSGSESGTSSPRTDSPNRNQILPPSNKPLSAREQLFGGAAESDSPQLSPVYQSEAAREIIEEMAKGGSTVQHNNRRQIPRGKRRHHTVSNIRMAIDTDRLGVSRARDDLDMERALRPRINAPDVVRSTLSQKDLKYNESTIDTILGTPNKIVIPERYVPENEPILTAEEQLHRLRKAESIRKMLSESSALSTPDLSTETPEEEKKTSTLRRKVEEEKKQREHLLQLNQILAQQVMEKSKLVAVKALARLPLEPQVCSFDEDDLSPMQPLPLYQQRENFYS